MLKPVNSISQKQIQQIRNRTRKSMPYYYILTQIDDAIEFAGNLVIRGFDILDEESKRQPIPITTRQLIDISERLKADIERAKRGRVTKHFYKIMFLPQFKWSKMEYNELKKEMEGTCWEHLFDED